MELATLIGGGIFMSTAWLIFGWLPTRLMKDYGIREFGEWTTQDELFFLGMAALGGPLMIHGVLLARLILGGPWGWRW